MPDVTIEPIKQGLYLPSFEVRDMEINGKCVAITRALSQALFYEGQQQFLNNLATSAELYERLAQGKQISKREEKEIFALSSLLDSFEQQLGSIVGSLPLSLIYTKSYQTSHDLPNYIDGIKGNFVLHLITSNHVVAIYKFGDNYSYFDSNVAFVSEMRDVQELTQIVEKGIKLAGYEVEEKGLLIEHFDVVKANSQLSNEDKQILAREIKTESQFLEEQDKEFGLIRINGQEISRVQLYDFGTKMSLKGSVPSLINADMNLSSKNFSEYLNAGKISIIAREYLDSVKGIKNVEEAVQATKFIPFIGSKSEIEKAEQTRKQKGSLLEMVKETINLILSTISLTSTSHLQDQLAAEDTSKKPDSYLGKVKVYNQLEKSLSF